MNSRERVKAALNHQTPDRVPLDLGSRSSAIEIEAYRELKRHLGIGGDSQTFIRSHAEMEPSIRDRLGVDTYWIHAMPHSCWRRDKDDLLFVDMWDVPWRQRNGYTYFELDTPPFRGLRQTEIMEREWPVIVTDEMARQLADKAKYAYTNEELSISCDTVGAGIFERAWYLRGLEEVVVDLLTEEAFSKRYLRKVLDIQLAGYEKVLNATSQYIQTVLMTDDVATQDSMIISPELYRKLIKPLQKELISYIQGRGVHVIFHSCGAVHDLIPDFLDIGVEVIHPVQFTASNMHTDLLKKEYGAHLVFWGGGCSVETLQFGTTDDVRREVEQKIADLSAGGGFVFTTTHCIQPGTPPENILAMADTLRKRGIYQ